MCPVDTWALAKGIRAKHLAAYLVAAFIVDHVLAYVDGPLVLWEVGRWLEISMILALAWLIVRLILIGRNA